MVARQTGIRWSPPSRSELEEMLSEAGDCLEKAWSNPYALGVDSDIAADCYKLRLKLVALDIPNEPDLRALHQKALWLSWCACWRSRDYTLDGWEKRAAVSGPQSDQLTQLVRSLRYHQIERHGAFWPSAHVPLFTRTGEIESFESSTSRTFQGYRNVPFFNEGWMLQRGMATAELFRKPVEASWAYFARESIFSNTEISNCWIASSAFPQGSTITDSVFENSNIDNPTIDDTSRWRNVLFLSDCSFRVLDRGTLDDLHEIKVGGSLRLRFEGNQKSETHLQSLHAIRRLAIDLSNSTNPAVSLTSCDLNLVVSGIKNSTFAHAISIEHSNLSLHIEGSGSGSVRIHDCALTAEIRGSILNKVEFSNSDVEALPMIYESRNGVRFHDVEIGSLSLENCDFDQRISQWGSTFDEIKVRACEFRDEVSFKDAKVVSSISFARSGSGKCIFRREFDLSCTSSKTSGYDIPSAEFLDCEFHDSLNLNNREFSGTTSFSGSQFNRRLLVHGASLHQDTSFGNAQFNWTGILNPQESLEGKRPRLESLSNSYRSLRQAMEANNASHDIQKFHVLQMRTRNHWWLGSAEPSERALGNIYDLISEYGTSFTRPLIGFVLVWIVTWMSYHLALPNDRSGSEIFSASFTSTFRPYITFNSTYDSMNSSNALLDSGHEVLAYLAQHYGGWFIFLSFLQSSFVVLLIFLMLLAIRRKYQLN